MPSINMIAPRRAEKLRQERDMRRLVFVIMAELVFVVALAGWVFTNHFTTGARIAELDAQIAKLQPVVDEIQSYETATTQIQPKLKLLNDAKSITMRWYSTLDMLTQGMPQSTYLFRITTDSSSLAAADGKKDDSQTGVIIGGVAATQAMVGETMLRIQSIPDLTNVELHFTRDTAMPECSAAVIDNRTDKQKSRRVLGTEFEIGTQLRLSDPKGANDGSNQSQARL